MPDMKRHGLSADAWGGASLCPLRGPWLWRMPATLFLSHPPWCIRLCLLHATWPKGSGTFVRASPMAWLPPCFSRAHALGGLCLADPHRSSVPEKKLYGVEGSSAFLECVPKSLQARVLWTYQKASDTPRKEVQGPPPPGDGLLGLTHVLH